MKESSHRPIVITGYPYAFPYYGRVFDFFSQPEDVILILPRRWEAKDGKVKTTLQERAGFLTIGLSALSFGGKSVLRGLYKGWMPLIAYHLLVARFRYHSRVLYSCSEPNLLTTLYNGVWAKLCGYRHILFTWQNVEPEQRIAGIKLWLSNLLVRCNYWFSDGVICGNTKAQDIAVQFTSRYDRTKTIVCPLSGVDTEQFKPGIPQTWKDTLGVRGRMILFYGALDGRKGVATLIRGFRHYVRESSRHQDDVLVIVGSGPDKDHLVQLAYDEGVASSIVFRDWMDNRDLPGLLNAADVFVYPSVPFGGWEEQFGYAIIEASSAAVPVIATRTGSIHEVVRDGETGLLVPPHDETSLALALEKILDDDTVRMQMGQSGRTMVEKKFSHRVVADTTMQFLRTYL